MLLEAGIQLNDANTPQCTRVRCHSDNYAFKLVAAVTNGHCSPTASLWECMFSHSCTIDWNLLPGDGKYELFVTNAYIDRLWSPVLRLCCFQLTAKLADPKRARLLARTSGPFWRLT